MKRPGNVISDQESQEIKTVKYSTSPTLDQGNFILFSMVLDIDELQKLLKDFPKPGDEVTLKDNQKYQIARACTVAWSGIEEYNVPVQPWNELPFGVVINPYQIDTDYGDMFAFGSHDVVPNKNTSEGGWYVSKIKEDTKYSGKIFVERVTHDNDYSLTNQAKILKQEDGHQVLAEGNIEVFAGNVWRKYVKRENCKTNEVLCTQKIGGNNPIIGLFLNSAEFLYDQDRSKIVEILQNFSHLNLYIYDRSQPRDIARVVDNSAAQELLSQKRDLDRDYISTLKPYADISESRRLKQNQWVRDSGGSRGM
ncbi:MAG: hypothetical protein V4694_05910 [Pseudomonadota bacterium]